MKSALVAALLAAAALTPAAAHADPYYGYLGGCSFALVDDPTPGGPSGGQDTWNGVVRVHVVPVDYYGVPTGAPVAAKCELRVDGVSRGIVLDAGSGTGVVAGAGPLTFTAADAAWIDLCSVVTIDSVTQTRCLSLTPVPICPAWLCEGNLLTAVIDAADDQVKALDPATCAALAAAAPTVDGLPSAGFLYVDPATGDTYAGGTTPADLLWDCPPYVTP